MQLWAVAIAKRKVLSAMERGIFSSLDCNWMQRAFLAAANKTCSEINGHTSAKRKFELYVYQAMMNVSTTTASSLHHESSRAVPLTSLRKAPGFNSSAKTGQPQKYLNLYKEEKSSFPLA